ncbi:MAG: hypothetical protein P1V81_08555 [Planctomycetota bacterium]|nr:hypothetical protein [Planctomycetota bacterium]
MQAPSPPPAQGARSKRRLRRIPRALALGLALLVAFEVGLRLVAPQPQRGLVDGLFEEVDGHSRIRPLVRGTHLTREFSVTYEGDADGYRLGTSAQLTDDELAGRIVVVGDSFAFGWGVEAKESATARLVQAGLPVVNHAMPGDGLGDYVQRVAELRGSGPAPRALVVVLYDNDLASAPPPEAPPTLRLRTQLLRLHSVRLVASWVDALGLADRAAESTGFAEARAAILGRDLWVHRREVGGLDPETEVALQQVLELAGQVAGEVHLVRVTPVYAAGGAATAAALARIGESAEAFDFGSLDQSLAARAAAAGASYASLAPTSTAQEEAWYYPADLHLTPAGQAALAELLLGQLGQDVR